MVAELERIRDRRHGSSKETRVRLSPRRRTRLLCTIMQDRHFISVLPGTLLTANVFYGNLSLFKSAIPIAQLYPSLHLLHFADQAS